MTTQTNELLLRLDELHQPTLQRVVGQGRAEALFCTSCTYQRYPCPTIKVIDWMRQELTAARSEVDPNAPCSSCGVPMGEHVTDGDGFLACLDGATAQPRSER